MTEAPVAIVTGGATGIGAAVARALAARGWRLGLGYRRSTQEAEATAEACRAAGGEALLHAGDVAEDGTCRGFAAAVLGRWGRIDALVNNAGTTKFASQADLEALEAADFARIFAVNVAGAYLMARAAAPALSRARGAVVNISSHAGLTGLGSSMAYAASKGALNTLTLSLARSLAPEVRVNALCPGFVDTRWSRGARGEADYAALKARIGAISPLGAMVAPADVAEAALWFIEGGARITGQLLVIDAGIHLTVNTPLRGDPEG